MARIANRIARLTIAGSLALLTAAPALAVSRADQPVQSWSAMQGIDVPELLDQAQDMPTSDMALGDQPYCADNPEIRQTLQHDFAEQPVDSSHAGTQLWASDQMGTWTLVAPRADQTSCIIASGIGYHPEKDVEVYYQTAGLN
ncbi:hypothetical protein J7376_04035 [Paracoccus sp. R12_1]|uniref:hypothetical protein n=1 Tax=unclassified Paracoccus (in: a-proteobacteria) TaxID=2688777 RepID=UPI001AD9D6A4|nr:MULTISPECIES: hypothetical protein [unclassified Paracoccus (in: a-proteobacteria)]MBO9453973.1 hypothetical protein [Paracoccus sp. R12_2]MBO9485680.1 hypothetical protein [Paracoccus sp. R12_1]